MKSRGILILVVAGVLASCQTPSVSLRTEKLSGLDFRSDITKIEEEAGILADRTIDPATLASWQDQLERMVADDLLPGKDRVRVLGLLGLVQLDAGQEGKALSTLKQMQSAFPDSEETALLQARTLSEGASREALDGWIHSHPSAKAPKLRLYRALLFQKEKDWFASLLDFEASLPFLPASWNDRYGPLRDLSYRMKDMPPPEDSTEQEWLSASVLNLQSMVGLVLTRTRYLRSPETNLPPDPASALADLARQGLLAPAGMETPPDMVADRVHGAWFLAHLAARLEGKDLMLQSGRYRTSPIPDIAVDSPWLIGVIWVVQRDLMPLSDGKNFDPNRPLTPAEWLETLAILERTYH